MNEVNHCIISAILKAKQRNKVHYNQTYVYTEAEIERFILAFFNYINMEIDAKEAFDEMYNQCIDLFFIQTKLQDILTEENDY